MYIFLVIGLIISVFLEGTFTTIPLTLLVLLCLMIVKRDAGIFPLAFFAGLLIDAMTLRPLGVTSLFLLFVLFVLLLYQRKYEMYTYQFVLVAGFITSILFLAIFRYEAIVWQALASALFACALFALVKTQIVDNPQRKY